MVFRPTPLAPIASAYPRRSLAWRRVQALVFPLLLWGLLSGPLAANDLGLSLLGQSPTNTVPPSTSVTYRIQTLNVRDPATPADAIHVGLEVYVDNVLSPANSSKFVTKDCTIDRSNPAIFICNDLKEKESQTVQLTWTDPDSDSSTIRFRGLCALVASSKPCRSNGISVTTKTVVGTTSVRFSSKGYSAKEGSKVANLSVEQLDPTGKAVSVQYVATGGTAKPGSDYELTPGTLSWKAGDSSPKILTVTLLDDSLVEGNESVNVSLTKPSGAFLGSPSSTTLTLVDDDVEADFSWKPESPVVGEGVQFLDLSLGTVNSWLWDFGDGQGSKEPSPTHTYRQPSKGYTVQLTVSGDGGTSTVQKSIAVYASAQPPKADFTWRPESPVVGDTVQFKDLSVGTVSAWKWDFGDGQGSKEQNPDHTYKQPSKGYTVQLTVSGDGGTSTVKKSVVVSPADQPPKADFDWSPEAPSNGQKVQFAVQSIGVIDLWDWSFGDGSYSSVREPIHIYKMPGTFSVTLAVKGPQGSSSVSHALKVTEQPVVEFTSGVTSGSESDDSLVVAVRRTSNKNEVRATVVVTGGSASPGSDYSFKSQALVWRPSDDNIKKVAIPLRDDLEVEPIETIDLKLTDVSGAVVGRGFSKAVIQDDDFLTHSEETIDDESSARRPVVSSFVPRGRTAARQIVVWEGDDGNGHGIFAKLLNADGVAVVPTFRVNPHRQGDQHSPSVIADSNGGFAVIWQGFGEGTSALTPRGTGGTLWGQFFDGMGAAKGSETAVADIVAGLEAAAAADSQGHVVVTWEEGGSILSQEVSEDGLFGLPIEIGQGQLPKIARLPTGSYAVVFQAPTTSTTALSPRGGGAGGLFASFFDSKGLPVEKDQPVADGVVGQPAMAAGSDFFVVAFAQQVEGGDVDIFASVLTLGNTEAVSAFRVNADRQGAQTAPSVAVNSSGDFVIAWESDDGVSARFFDRNAQAIGGDVGVASSSPAETPAAPQVTIDDNDVVRVVWERRSAGGANNGVASRVIEPAISSGCTVDSTTLCLQQDLFEVQVQWRTPTGDSGVAHAEPLTQDTGYFWFFDEANVEMLIKVLDGCDINDRFWVFAGGLTNVETIVVVTNTVDGRTQRYRNPISVPFEPVQDTAAFRSCDLRSPQSSLVTRPVVNRLERSVASELWQSTDSWQLVGRGSNCIPSGRRLCLNGGRYAVEADWNTASTSGEGHAERLTEDTGYFWFFDQANVEMVVKVLDACSFSGRVWVFAGGLTNVAVQWSVTDTLTGATAYYENPLSTTFLPLQDTSAFTSCP